MFKNVAAQKFRVFAFNATTNLPKTGDAANLTAYVSKDYGAVTVLADTSATEEDATNAAGYYLFDAAQAETNADVLLVSGKSSTADIVVIGAPASIDTRPAAFGLVAGAAGGLFIAGTNAATTITGSLTTTFTGDLTGSVASVTGAVGSVTGNVGGNVTGSVGSIATGGITTASFAAGAINAAALATDAVNEIADGVWDEAIAGHLTAGSTGAALNAAGSAGDPWTTLLPGAYGAGTAGFIVGTNLDAAVTTRLAPTVAGRTLDVTTTGAAGIDWGNLENPATPQNLSATNIDVDQVVASVSGAVGSVTGAVGSVTGNVGGNVTGSVGSVVGNVGGNVVGSVGSVAAGGITAASIATDAIDADAIAASAVTEIQAGLSTLTAGQVNAEVVDALSVDTYAEPTGVPGATVSIAEKTGRVYQALRNALVVDSNTSKLQFKNDAGTVIWEKDLTDAGGVYEETEGNAP